MPVKFNELLLKPDIIELYNEGITPNYGYLLNGRLEKDMVRTLYPLPNLNGNPITWEANKMEYLFPSVSLQPKQAGSGDPSPENVRPISGWDEVTVTRNGQNLLKFPYYSTSGPSVTYNGIDAQIHEDGKVSIHGTTAESGYNFIFQYENDFFIPPGKYYIDVFGAELPVGSSVLVYNPALGAIANSALNKKSFTLNEGTGVRVYINSGESGVQFNIDGLGVILCVQSAPTAFIPYTGATATLTLPEIIYGGTVDAVTGVGSEEWAFVELDGSETLEVGVDNLTSVYRYYIASYQLEVFYSAAQGVCSHLPVGDSTQLRADREQCIIGFKNKYIYLYLNKTDFPNINSVSAWLAAQAAAGTPVQVAYKLATPEPFQATGNQQLTSLLGYNTIYTDGNSMVLSRKARRLEV